MAQIGLNEAARLSGRNRSTLHRAMKDGRLSYTLDEAGERRIDVAELERVFGTQVAHGNGAHPAQSNMAQHGEIELLRQWLADRDETVRDLRHRLDAADQRLAGEIEERRRLTALLRPPEAPDPPCPLGRRILAWARPPARMVIITVRDIRNGGTVTKEDPVRGRPAMRRTDALAKHLAPEGYVDGELGLVRRCWRARNNATGGRARRLR